MATTGGLDSYNKKSYRIIISVVDRKLDCLNGPQLTSYTAPLKHLFLEYKVFECVWIYKYNKSQS